MLLRPPVLLLSTRTSKQKSTHVTSAGDVKLSASDIASVDSNADTISIAGSFVAIAVAALTANNTIRPEVTAAIADSTVIALGSGIIDLNAFSQPTVHSDTIVGAIAGIVGFAGAGGNAKTHIADHTQAYISGSALTADNDSVQVKARSITSASPSIFSLAAGAVGVNVMLSDVQVAGSTHAYVSGNSTISTSTLDLISQDSNSVNPTSTVAAGGLIAINVSDATFAVTRETTAEVKTGTLNMGTGRLNLQSSSITNGKSNTDSVTASLISVGVTNNVGTVNNKTESIIAEDATIVSNGGSITVDAASNNNVAARIDSFGVGILLNVNVSDPIATLAGSTEAKILGDIQGVQGSGGAGSILVNASTTDAASAGSVAAGGGAISLGGRFTFKLEEISDVVMILCDGDDFAEVSSSINLRTFIEGSAGDDYLVASSGDATLLGGAGNDRLIGRSGNDVIEGGDGDDWITGGAGADAILGGQGKDSLIEQQDANMTITDGALNIAGSIDSLSSIEVAILTGGDSNNILDASQFTGQVTLDGDKGDDILLGGTGNDVIYGGDGNDVLSGGIGDDILAGCSGTDQLNESADVDFTLSNQTLRGLGNDALNSIESAWLTGGSGNNRIDASTFDGPTTLVGGSGADVLIGGNANDILQGLAGNDLLTGGAGNDVLNGGTDFDTLIEAGNVNFTLTNAQLVGMGTDTLTSIESAELTGGSSANTLDASAFTLGSVKLDGANGNDTLRGTSANDTLKGGAGNDLITGNAGNDSIDGGNDWDTVVESGDINFTLTNDQLIGLGTDSLASIESASLTGGNSSNILDASAFTAGPITLVGGSGNDTLRGGSKNDILRGGIGDDTITSGMGDDTVDGGTGIDTIVESADVNMTLTNTLLTGIGSDSLIGIENAMLIGGQGNNTLNASAFTLGPVTLNGSDGDDSLQGSTSNDTLIGGIGFDTVVAVGNVNFALTNSQLVGLGTDSLSGIESANLTGGPSANMIDASLFTLGPVTLIGAQGNDTLKGGAGNDRLDAGSGNDSVWGGPGDDVLLGGDGNDILRGESGNDRLTGDLGNDTLDGGTDSDTIVEIGNVNFTLTNSQLVGMGTDILASIESAELTGGASANTIDASAFSSGPVKLNGAAGNDTLLGGTNSDVLDGGDGDDTSLGGAGNDQLIGGLGNDILVGGDGNDQLVGGDGWNVLIGGAGNDELRGGKNEDLMIGGSSSYDQYVAQLKLIMAEWSTTSRNFETRINNLRSGTGSILKNTGIKLTKTGSAPTVLPDSAADTLVGDGGRDWFFAELSEDVIDNKSEDQLN